MALRAATRGSALALWQADRVAGLVSASGGGPVESVVVSTVGDRRADVPIHQMGGKGVFVKEVQAAVLDGRADIAVHSAKDLPAETPDDLVLVAVPERGDPRDVLVGSMMADLPAGAHVATGSVRRRVQLAWHRPDLTFSELRGNIATRLKKLSECDAIVMAAAALDRLELEPDTVDVLEPSLLVPQVGQGALAVECRADDSAVIDALTVIEHARSRRAVDSERAFLAELGGDCDLPAGGHAVVDPDGHIEMVGLLASPDGHVMLRERRSGREPDPLGRGIARHLLDEAGGSELLESRR